MDAYQRNELRLKALAKVDAAARKKLKLGRVLEVAGDSPADARYILNFNQVFKVGLPALKLKGIVGLPGLGARVDECFGNAGETDTKAVKEFLLRPELANLKSLECHGMTIGPASVAFEKSEHLGSLERLGLRDTSIKFSSLLAAKSLVNLRDLDLTSNQLDSDDLLALLRHPSFAKVTRLGFAGNDLGELDEIVAAPELGRIQDLAVGGSNRQSWAVLTETKHLGGLRKLDFSSGPRDESAGRILAHKGFGSLEDLTLVCMGKAYKKIALPKLKRLSIYLDTVKSAQALAADPAIGQLDHLTLSLIDSAQQAIPDLYASAHFRKLPSLRLHPWSSGSDESDPVYQLPAFERLRSFVLLGAPVDEASMTRMLKRRPFRRLEQLELAGGADAGAARVLAASKELAELEELRLPHGQVRDEGTAALARSPHMKSLQVLDLSGADMKDAGVTALAESDNFARLVALRIKLYLAASKPARAALNAHRKMPKLWILSGLTDTFDPELRDSKGS